MTRFDLPTEDMGDSARSNADAELRAARFKMHVEKLEWQGAVTGWESTERVILDMLRIIDQRATGRLGPFTEDHRQAALLEVHDRAEADMRRP